MSLNPSPTALPGGSCLRGGGSQPSPFLTPLLSIERFKSVKGPSPRLAVGRTNPLPPLRFRAFHAETLL